MHVEEFSRLLKLAVFTAIVIYAWYAHSVGMPYTNIGSMHALTQLLLYSKRWSV